MIGIDGRWIVWIPVCERLGKGWCGEDCEAEERNKEGRAGMGLKGMDFAEW